MKINFKWLPVAFLSSALLVACGDKQEKQSSSEQAKTVSEPAKSITLVKPKLANPPFLSPATLQTMLPASTLGYLRIPSFWGLLMGQGDKSLALAMNNQAHVSQIAILKDSIQKNIIDDMDLDLSLEALIKLLAIYSSSPLEIALIKQPENTTDWYGLGVLSTRYNDIEQVNKTLQFLFKEGRPVKFMPLAETHDGALQLPNQQKILVQFDKPTAQLRFLLQPKNAASMMTVAQAWQATKGDAATSDKMDRLQNKIDQSDQGLFVWLNTEQVALNSRMLPPPAIMALNSMGLNQAKQLALGVGSANTQGKLAFLAEMPNMGFRQYLPLANNQFDFNTYGDVDSVFALAIPRMSDLMRIEQIAALSSPEELKEYRESLKQFEQGAGMHLYALIEAFGPELVLVKDHIGRYVVAKVSNPELIDQLFETLKQKNWASVSEKTIKDKTFYHLQFDKAIFAQMETKQQQLLGRFMMPNIYWVKEGNYWVFAGIPQLLMERAQLASSQPLKQWLKKSQHVDFENALVSMSFSVDELPRMYYHAYIGLLDALAKGIDAPIDLYALPTASELALPDSGAVSFQLDSSEQMFGFTLTYQNTLLDPYVAMFNDMGAVAVIGILSAVAIPAYQDYQTRAEVSGALTQVQLMIGQVNQHHAENGQWPSNEMAQAMVEYNPKYTINFDGESKTIVVYFNDSRLSGEYIEFQLQEDGNGNTWQCVKRSVPDKFSPASLKAVCEYYYDYQYDY